jgi:hypothetical protein
LKKPITKKRAGREAQGVREKGKKEGREGGRGERKEGRSLSFILGPENGTAILESSGTTAVF